MPDSFYALKTKTLQGKPADLSQYKGKVTLVVNVASQCGYTPQYTGLEKLHQDMKGKPFEVLGFPSNDFGAQEPGSAEEIATFCKKNYGVTFPLFEKVVTKAGPEQSPIYSFLGQSGLRLQLETWDEHAEILEAIAARRIGRARMLARSHVERVKLVVVAYLVSAAPATKKSRLRTRGTPALDPQLSVIFRAAWIK